MTQPDKSSPVFINHSFLVLQSLSYVDILFLSLLVTWSIFLSQAIFALRIFGATENARPENAKRSKMQGWKMH